MYNCIQTFIEKNTKKPRYGGTARRRAASPRTNVLDATTGGDQERSQREVEQEEAYALNALRSKTQSIAIQLTLNQQPRLEQFNMELDTGASVTIYERAYVWFVVAG